MNKQDDKSWEKIIRSSLHLDEIDCGEVSAQAMQAPLRQRQLQEAKNAIHRVVYCHHFAKVLHAKQRPKDGIVRGVQEETPRTPYYKRHNLHTGPHLQADRLSIATSRRSVRCGCTQHAYMQQSSIAGSNT